jgi:16S rRNA (guanine527-N7)-methyltransferase
MEEAEARRALDVPRETFQRLERFVELLEEENHRQNLVSKGSLEHIWARHVYDSAQLLRFAPADAATWLDLGSGAGFPGLVVALLHPARVTLVEARKLRADFLRRAAKALGVADKVEIACVKIGGLAPRSFDVISARAFAPLDRLLPLAAPFSGDGTVWILPKGRNAKSELEAARSSWQGDFRLEPSLTDDEAGIVVARGVRRLHSKGKR